MTLFYPTNIKKLPLNMVLLYLCFTIIVFLEGPYYWPASNYNTLLFFLMAVLVAIMAGYTLALKFTARAGRNINWMKVYLIGITAALILFIPTVHIYTGSYPWYVYYALKHPGIAYTQMEMVIHEPKTLLHTIISLLMVFASPFTFAIIPLGILQWRSLKLIYKILFFIYIVIQLIFSIMRGTDKEIADLIIISFSSLLILYGRAGIANQIKFSFRKIIPWILGIIFTLFIALTLFNERKYQRVNSFAPYCTYGVCPSYSGPILSKLDEQEQFSLSMLAGYLTQGYYGLSLALSDTGKFQSTYGLGHSMALLSIYTKFTNNNTLYQRSYMYKINQTGRWSDLNTWSTIFPWIASDISFPLVPLMMGIIAALLAVTWRDAIEAENNCAAIVFTFLIILFLYIPANNQIAQSLNSYFAFAVWLIIWVYKRHFGYVKCH